MLILLLALGGDGGFERRSDRDGRSRGALAAIVGVTALVSAIALLCR